MLIKTSDQGKRLDLTDPVAMPKAAAFLWNKKMMIHMNCRGFAVSQFMQPEPAKYAHAPNLEAKTFMQPEQPYYAHHAGRFFYIKDVDNQDLFSIPHEPVKNPMDEFIFSAGESDIQWLLKKNNLEIKMQLDLTKNDAVELWTLQIKNNSAEGRKIQVFPYFPVGYMSWMNQSALYDEQLGAIICSSISPYQKYQDYDKVKEYKDKTFLLAGTAPDAYEVRQEAFEGEGGLQNPTAIQTGQLKNGEARYETPACAMQYNINLLPQEEKSFNFVFGPAKDRAEIERIKDDYLLSDTGFIKAKKAYHEYVSQGKSCLTIHTPNKKLDNFVNTWLPRQIYYHGETNRLSTDPQTRNYLQDNMGMGYIKPEVTRNAFLTAIGQQEFSGAMPDGILIEEGAELKYINQVPHTDHCVWLPVCLKAYLDETNDSSLLHEKVGFANNIEKATVADHITKAMTWLLENRDHRGLNYINQGDWCDPMNMVGYKGKGVSGWLTLATSYALKVWLEICKDFEIDTLYKEFENGIQDLNNAVNEHLWDGSWYARGITDDNVVFGIKKDQEGSIFLNPQAWSILSDSADAKKESLLIASVKERLETPYGVEMLSPSFTKMREDVGRVTQKHPGSAENGSVYNHAASFYIYALYTKGYKNDAFRLIDKMIPGADEDDLIQRGQLPVFIPNYYRGAFKQFPRTAGRSSQLFNTGTAHWIYRCLIDGLFGLKGEPGGLRIQPQLPDDWQKAQVVRTFRGAEFHVNILRSIEVNSMTVYQNERLLDDNLISDFKSGDTIQILIHLPV
ncbi:GH36-type glycosyl hydrolase domain-containing protein [Lutimonas sp.]|uniref:GH36-type glycosyl hydrolase domain-containing protein n=1 Tax=Lutimonas sp. TaxID=1872403 RepID=UPI003D9B0286